MKIKKPNDKLILRKALGKFATGIAVVTTDINNKTAGLTINSFSSLSLEPPLVIWNISIKSSLKDIILDCQRYVIHILSYKQSDIANIFASSNKIEKFNYINTKLSPSGTIMINDNFLAWFDCINYKHYKEGDHIIMIGEIKYFSYNEGDPLIFYAGNMYKNFFI